MDNNTLISWIYFHYKDVARVICAYYDEKNYVPEQIDSDIFTQTCNSHFVNKYPTILFNFLERNDVQLVIMPKFVTNSNSYGYMVMYGNNFIYATDCVSKSEAEYRAIMSSIEMLSDAQKKGKIIKYTKPKIK